MNVIAWQVILALVHFILTLVCALAPIKLVRNKGDKTLGSKSQRVISFCNCISGGVFLATLFVGLMPFVRTKFSLVLHQFKSDDINYPLAELTVVLGYFLILIIEQCAVSLQNRGQNHKELRELVTLPDDYHLATISSESDIDSDDELSPNEEQCLTKTSQKTATENSHNSANNLAKSSKHSTKRSSKTNRRLHENISDNTNSCHQDHGHGHSHSHMVDMFGKNLGLRSILLLLAMSVHSVFEGLALGLQENQAKLLNLYTAVLVHECMVAFALGINLAKNTMTTATIIKLLVLFCITIPLGMMVGLGIGVFHNVGAELASAIIQGVAAGTFLYVIFQEIFPEELNVPKDRWLKSLFIFIGFFVIACLRITLIHEKE